MTYRPKPNEALLLMNEAVIIPRYVRESERPTSDGDCVTGPLIDNPEGWYVEYTYPGDTNEHRTFIAYDDVAGGLSVMVGDRSTCVNCSTGIVLDDNGAGGTVWCHDFGSTVCHDDPPGSHEDGDTTTVAEPRCPHPGGSRVNDGEWECSRCGHIFASYEAWAEATGNWAVTNAIAAELGLLEDTP